MRGSGAPDEAYGLGFARKGAEPQKINGMVEVN